ncbi:hypothetical protein [Paracoccus sp. ME4]|uniref:hypothetical protein n=1 Tax=Paracoccus sp. ME4 TaxID=3138066 RepID=UPI00398BA95D
MTNIEFWTGPAHGNQRGTTERGAITKDGDHVAEYEVYAKRTLVRVTYKGREKATQIGGTDWQTVARMLLRELMCEATAAA